MFIPVHLTLHLSGTARSARSDTARDTLIRVVSEMKPVIKRWKIWAITIIGGYFGAGMETSRFSVYGTGGFNISLMGAIEGAILIDLGYLLIVWVLSNGF